MVDRAATPVDEIRDAVLAEAGVDQRVVSLDVAHEHRNLPESAALAPEGADAARDRVDLGLTGRCDDEPNPISTLVRLRFLGKEQLLNVLQRRVGEAARLSQSNRLVDG